DDGGCLPLSVGRVLEVPQDEGVLPRLTVRERNVELVRTDGVPAGRDRVGGLASVWDGGLVEAVAESQEGVAVCVEAGDRSVHRVDRVVVAARAVLGLVIDRTVFDLDLTER